MAGLDAVVTSSDVPSAESTGAGANKFNPVYLGALIKSQIALIADVEKSGSAWQSEVHR